LLGIRAMRALVQRVRQASVSVDGAILAVSQFTLYGSTHKGNRPSWSAAAPPELARPRFDAFVQALALRIGKRLADRRLRRAHAGRPGQRRAGDAVARFAPAGMIRRRAGRML
jgi:hypothetical protein